MRWSHVQAHQPEHLPHPGTRPLRPDSGGVRPLPDGQRGVARRVAPASGACCAAAAVACPASCPKRRP
nr:hypothetical protein [Azospirillum argentinense]